MSFEIVRNDIINMDVDAIVNTANPRAVIGSGVDSAIHKAAGPQLLEARKIIGDIKTGNAVITPGFNLRSCYVIHTAGPYWIDGNHNEEEYLAACYRNSLALAKKHHCESIAFPLISTGNYGFPKALALQIAVREFSAFLMENDIRVYLVVFGNEEFILSEKLVKSVESFIDENYIREKQQEEYYDEGGIYELRAPRRFSASKRCKPIPREDIRYNKAYNTDEGICKAAPCHKSNSIEDMLEEMDAGFSETLLKLIDKTGKKDPEIYKKANVDRKHFSKIRNNPDYQPSKATAIAFAFALNMTLEETREFISRAGYALSHSSKFDIIVEYFLIHQNYDVFELNEVLFKFDQPLVGA